MLPLEIVRHIYSFVPHLEKEEPKYSPSLQHELERIAKSNLKGTSATYLKDLDDFCLK